MASTRRYNNEPPSWDGTESTWVEYCDEVRWYEESLKPSERPQLVARLVRQLTGAGKKAMKRVDATKFRGAEASVFLEYLRGRIGVLPIPDLGHRLDDYFFRLKRSARETTPEWSIKSWSIKTN